MGYTNYGAITAITFTCLFLMFSFQSAFRSVLYNPRKMLTVEQVISGAQISNTVIVTTTNFGFLDMFENFLQSIRNVAPNRTNMVLVIAEDYKAYKYLQKHYPRNLLPIMPENVSQIEKKLNFNTPEYMKLVSRRPTHLLEVIRHNVNILYIDADSVWLKDPFDYMKLKPATEFAMISDSNNYYVHGKLIKNNLHTCAGYCCSCFLYMKPTENVKKLLKMWAESLSPAPGLDQNHLNSVFPKIRGLRYQILSPILFPNGDFYFNTDFFRKTHTVPVIVHDNYIVGHKAKLKRFKDFHMWFIGQNGTFNGTNRNKLNRMNRNF